MQRYSIILKSGILVATFFDLQHLFKNHLPHQKKKKYNINKFLNYFVVTPTITDVEGDFVKSTEIENHFRHFYVRIRFSKFHSYFAISVRKKNRSCKK